MSRPIWVAVISVGMMVFARIVMGLLALVGRGAGLVAVFVPIAIAVLILVGIIRGHRLAWQWGRIAGLIAGVLLTGMAVGAAARARQEPGFIVVAALLAMQGIPLFPMFFALGTHAAKQHFRLICPVCGSTKTRSKDFLYTRALCPHCQATWD